MSRLPVYFERRVVGWIEADVDGPGFRYDAGWLTTSGAFPVSTAMPLGPARIPWSVFLTWASNLLPENEQLQIVGRYLGAASSDVIGILSAIGRDTAGALSIGRAGTASPAGWRVVEREDDLERIINELPSKPFLIGQNGVSMSLAGVQSKLGVAVDPEGRICIPTDGSPSTHILKPDSTRLWGGVQNEAFCLTLAQRIGISTASVTTGRAGDRTYLLVGRYDRMERDGRWRRLHQEDFCQILGVSPAAKYETNQTGVRGPGLADMFAALRRLASGQDVANLLDMVIFNVIACNTDAHAKNYALLIGAAGNRLAPLYDVMCGEVWENVTRNIAQKIAGKRRGEYLTGRHWVRFAGECGFNPRQVLGRVRRLAEGVRSEAASAAAVVAAMPAGDHSNMTPAREAVERRAGALLVQLDELGTGLDEADEAANDEPAATTGAPRPR